MVYLVFLWILNVIGLRGCIIADFFFRGKRVAGWEFGLECEAEWFPGSWMSRQRCAGRRGGKAEFPCGLRGVSD